MTDSLIPYSFVPGTKAKASEVNANFIALADAIDLSNGSISDLSASTDTKLANKLDLNMANSPAITNCIVAAPNGVVSYSGMNITAKSGLKVLIPNGRNSDGTLKNTTYTLQADVSITDVAVNNRKLITLSSAGSLMLIFKSYYLTGDSNSFPTTLADANTYIFYAKDINIMYITTGSTTANWTPTQLCIIGEYNMVNSEIEEFVAYKCINLSDSADKSLSNLDRSSIFNVVHPVNTAMELNSSRTLATIGSRSYYKSYNEECICAIVTGSSGYSAPMLVSNTVRGATGYDDSNTTPRISGGIEWNGKIWYYMVGSALSLSQGLRKWTHIPIIIKTASTYEELAKYVLETYYSSLTYSMPQRSYAHYESWYRVWGDGWIEQGGETSATASVSVTFSKPFSNTNYTVMAMKNGNTGDTRSTIVVENKATTGFTLTSSDARVKNWFACGY